MMKLQFEEILKGGHPNSLGDTLKVVDAVKKDERKLKDLIDTYSSRDEVVRLRVSNALKRITIEHPEWTYKYIDRILKDISQIDQASTKWTMAIIFKLIGRFLNNEEREKAISIMKENLSTTKDWIVINMTMETLFLWSMGDESLKKWLQPKLEFYSKDKHKSIARRAQKYLEAFD